MPKYNTLTTQNADQIVKQWELSFMVSRNANWYIHFGRQFEASYKTKHILIILGINLKIAKTYVHPKPCTCRFIAAFFIITQT